jgi:DNA mismatch repair protein MutS
MVEMMEAASILRHASPRSLIVLDEIGRGTSTFDGLSIARAVVEEVHERIGARTLFATHFHELADLADQLPRVRVFNAAVSEQDGDVVFLRKIVPGAADRSYGIHVARLAGLPHTVTRRAQVILRELEERAALALGPRDRDGGSSRAIAESPTPYVGAAQRSADERSVHPLQPALDGFESLHDAPNRLLEEVLSLELATLTPLEALNKLWDLQRRAGRV